MIPPTNDIDVFYICLKKGILLQPQFLRYIDENHLLTNQRDGDDSACDGIQSYTSILKSTTESKGGVRSEAFYNYVVDNYGDADVSNGTRWVNPALIFYSGTSLRINRKIDIKKGRTNGTLCRGISIKLKKREQLYWKNWDDEKVLSICMKNMDDFVYDHWKDGSIVTSVKSFKVYPENILLKWIGK